MANKITYEDKISLYDDETILNENKVTANDMNEIKQKVNDNADELDNTIENISNLQAELEEAQAETERLRSDLNLSTATVSGEGESITLSGTSGARFKKLGISGNSTQETRSGKNLAKILDGSYTFGSVPFTVEKGIIKLTGAPTGNYMFSEFQVNSGNATLSIDVTGYTDSVSSACYIILQESSNRTDWISKISLTCTSTTVKQKTETLDSTKYYRIRWYTEGNTFTNGTIKVQLEYGTEKTSFEQYGVQPSSDYPSTIRNCGENVNEFDGELEIGLIDWNTGENGKNNNRMRSKNYVQIDKNETYTFSWDNTNLSRITIYEYKDNYEYYKTNAIYIYNGDTYKPTTTDAKYIRFFTSDNFNDTTTKIKIEKGTKSTPYSPYNCGNANITINGGENMLPLQTNKSFSVNGVTFSILNETLHVKGSTTSTISNSNPTVKENFKFTLPAGKYCFKNNSTRSCFLKEYSNDIDIESTSGSFELQEETQVYFSVYIYQNRTVDEDVPLFLYQDQTITFPLSEGQRLYKRSYLAEDGIHHVRGQIVLKGSEDENWKIWQITATNVQRFYIEDIITPKTPSTSLCSHFKFINDNSDVQHFRYGGVALKEFIIYIDRTIETVEQLKVWLQSNPITVEYPLNEEVIVPYTSAQQEVWDYIEKEAHSYEGTTHITCPDETSLNFEVEAIRSPSVVDERLDNIESRLALIE